LGILHLRLGLPLCLEPFLMVWQEPHLGQRNIEAGESFVRRLWALLVSVWQEEE